MPSTYLACRRAMARFYDRYFGRPPVVTTRLKPARLETRPDEARRCRQGDTDGSRRRAVQTKLRHQMH
jgi:hypothetical protein